MRAKHIRAGSQKHCDSCAVALAIKDMGFGYSYVTSDGVVAGYDTYVPSKSLLKFIRAFDQKKSSVKPTTFVLKSRVENDQLATD